MTNPEKEFFFRLGNGDSAANTVVPATLSVTTLAPTGPESRRVTFKDYDTSASVLSQRNFPEQFPELASWRRHIRRRGCFVPSRWGLAHHGAGRSGRTRLRRFSLRTEETWASSSTIS